MSGWFHRHAGLVVPVVFGLLLVGGMVGIWSQGDLIWAVAP